MSRFTRVVGVIGGVMATTLLFASCTDSMDRPIDPRPTETGTAAEGFGQSMFETVNESSAVGGTLRVGVLQSCGSLVPKLGTKRRPRPLDQSPTCRNIQRATTRQLVGFAGYPGGSGFTVLPDLAEDLGSLGDDGRSVTYRLRTGVTWQDGTAITADDVVAGLANFAEEFPDVGFIDATAPDASTVVVRLQEPFPALNQYLAMSAASPRPANGARLASGPFMVEQTDERRTRLIRNPTWNQDTDVIRIPHVDSIDIIVFESATDLENAVIAEDVDLSLGPGADDAEATRLLSNALTAGSVDIPAVGNVTMLALRSTVAPLDNVSCRRAIYSAMDRQALVDASGGPFRRQLANVVTPSNYPSYASGYEPYPNGEGKGDLDAARAQLAECGQSEGFAMTVSFPIDKGAEFIAIREALDRVGISVLGLPMDPNTAPADETESTADAVLMEWSSVVPSIHAFWQPLVGDDARNIAGVNQPLVDALMSSPEMGSADLAIQADVGRMIDRLVLDGAFYIPLTYETDVFFRATSLTNVTSNSALGSRVNIVDLGVTTTD